MGDDGDGEAAAGEDEDEGGDSTLGADMDDEIGLMTPEAAAAEEAAFNADPTTSTGAISLDNRNPSTHEGAVLSIDSLDELERQFSHVSTSWHGTKLPGNSRRRRR